MHFPNMAFLIPGILLSVLVACGGNQAPESPVTDWQFEGSTYQVVSGIAGDVPSFWVERGWAGGGVLVYLADQEITCDDFPTEVNEVTKEFPPRLLMDGATIWLKLTEKNTGAILDSAQFDVMVNDGQGNTTGSGLSTDAVRAGLTALEQGRVRGWLELAQAGDEFNQQLSISGTFDVLFCG